MLEMQSRTPALKEYKESCFFEAVHQLWSELMLLFLIVFVTMLCCRHNKLNCSESTVPQCDSRFIELYLLPNQS